jgi:hypothetical protein
MRALIVIHTPITKLLEISADKGKAGAGVSNLMNLLKMVAVLVAAIIIGNWFLAENRKARSQGKPWYQPYLSAPGILIILAILLPIVWWIIKN